MLSHFPTTTPIDIRTVDTPQSAQRVDALLALHREHDARGLAELLDACHGNAAGDRARQLARLARDRDPDLGALRATATLLMRDLEEIQSVPDLCAPEKLQTQAAETLDAAVLYHTGRIATLQRALARPT